MASHWSSKPREIVRCPTCERTRSVAAITAWNIRTGRLSGECLSCAVTVKGHTKHRLYGVWLSMRARCRNPRDASYSRYGGRGIRVCARWDDFANFIEDVEPTYASGLWLDRIDNDGPYSPDNFRWATPAEQSRNTRRSVLLTHDGRTQAVEDWAKELGFNPNTLAGRIRRGWPSELALTTPLQRGRRRPTLR